MSQSSCQPLTATADDGARVSACALGATVLGWVPASGGPDRLWVSPTTGCGPGVPVRGGVPLVFPQFGGGPLPKHGFLRDRAWQPLPRPAGDDRAAVLAFRLQADAATRAVWPYDFTAELVARAIGEELSIDLTVTNDDSRPFAFTACLHAYFAVPDAGGAVLSGLQGRVALDKNAGGAAWAAPGHSFSVVPPADLVFPGAGDPVECTTGAGGLVVTADGLPDRVVWNPGPGHGLADVPEGAQSGFLCVEPAAVEPIDLPAAGVWTGRMVVLATAP